MIINFNNYLSENLMSSDAVTELKRSLVKILRSSGYIVIQHERIYSSTIKKRTDLINTIYSSFEHKYNEILYIDTISLKKLKEDQSLYGSKYFYIPIELLYLYKKNVINKKDLPIIDELMKIDDEFQKLHKVSEFNI